MRVVNTEPQAQKPFQTEAPAKPTYLDADVDSHIGAWANLVEGGKKTPDQIIAMVGMKHSLTPDQIERIRRLA
jgi:hypothetical protein